MPPKRSLAPQRRPGRAQSLDTLAGMSTSELIGVLERRATGGGGHMGIGAGVAVEWALEGDAGPTRDERGEELVHALADRLRREGKRFEDEYFPPSDESLYQFMAPVMSEECRAPTAAGAVRRDHSKFGCDKDGQPLQVRSEWEKDGECKSIW